MRHVRNSVFIHLVWATWDRLPLLVETAEREAYRAIQAKCQELDAEVIALGGIEDHVHLLVRLPSTLAAADLVKHVKGSSAHLLSRNLQRDSFFKWQGGYAAFSVSADHLGRVREYIAHQREHHATSALLPGWEIPVQNAEPH